jgi:DNA repair protein RecO (recombination protein O)
MSNSRALVIKSIKQGETSSMVSCYLEEIGFKSFLVKGLYSQKKSRFSKAHFFPLNIININYSFNESRGLGFIKEVKSEFLFKTIHTDIQKSSVIVFLSEILNSVFREELEVNQDLFNFLLSSLIWYDNIEECNNYHIKFLLELTKYIGFYPNIRDKHDMYFCLESGSTSSTKPLAGKIEGQDLNLLKELLGTKFEDLNTMSINRESRTRILNKIIDYYSLHLQMFKTPKSIHVFTEVFK